MSHANPSDANVRSAAADARSRVISTSASLALNRSHLEISQEISPDLDAIDVVAARSHPAAPSNARSRRPQRCAQATSPRPALRAGHVAALSSARATPPPSVALEPRLQTRSTGRGGRARIFDLCRELLGLLALRAHHRALLIGELQLARALIQCERLRQRRRSRGQIARKWHGRVMPSWSLELCPPATEAGGECTAQRLQCSLSVGRCVPAVAP